MKKDVSSKPSRKPITVLDIGSSKIVCFIAHADGSALRITGIGHQLSKGIRAGAIIDVTEAETSIIAAVHAAEQMAGETVEDVIVSLTGGLVSRGVAVEMALLGEEVTERDVMDIIDQGRAGALAQEQDVIHCLPVSYALDGAKGIADPRRMFGGTLGADLHLITCPKNILKNLAHCIGRCHLNVAGHIAAPYASGLSVLEEDERQLGVTVIDMGGGTTSIAVFAGGKNIFSDIIPIGGQHVTSDIAKGLSTTLAHAERLKTLHGSAIATSSDDQVMVSVPQLGDDDGEEGGTLPRSMLVGIIRPRLEEIFEMVKGKLEASGVQGSAGRRVVLTGGASQLLGVREVAGSLLGKQARQGRPKPVAGLAEAVSGPPFATALGMLHYAVNKPEEERLLDVRRQKKSWFGIDRLLGWVRESF